MKLIKTLFKILFFIAIFLGGMYFYTQYTGSKQIEGLTTMDGELRCPNLLIQKGSKYFLYNSNIAKVPGVNPIEFNNLEEYVEFLEWQRGAGIRCPVLYLQNTYDAQGERVYKIRPSVTELQGGLPPTVPTSTSTPTTTTTTEPPTSVSPNNQVNTDTQNLLFSPNAMDDNWGGAQYTESLVDAGYYAGNVVEMSLP